MIAHKHSLKELVEMVQTKPPGTPHKEDVLRLKNTIHCIRQMHILTESFSGKACPDFEPECACCAAWKLYEEMATSLLEVAMFCVGYDV